MLGGRWQVVGLLVVGGWGVGGIENKAETKSLTSGLATIINVKLLTLSWPG